MKYILIYTQGFCCCVERFKNIQELEKYINKNFIDKKQIKYFGEYKPLKYKITLGVD